jgi:hypothetical protein
LFETQKKSERESFILFVGGSFTGTKNQKISIKELQISI